MVPQNMTHTLSRGVEIKFPMLSIFAVTSAIMQSFQVMKSGVSLVASFLCLQVGHKNVLEQ